MANIPLTFAIGRYEHLRDLLEGTVGAEDIDFTFPRLPTEEIFYRFVRYREWDVSKRALRAFAVCKFAAFRRCPNTGSQKAWANRGSSRGKKLPAALSAQSPMSDVIAAWSHW